MEGHTVDELLALGAQKYSATSNVTVKPPTSDSEVMEFIEAAMFPVRLYASYEGVAASASDADRADTRHRIYECLRHYYEFYDKYYVNEVAKHGYFPHYVMSYVFLPMLYRLFPDNFINIVMEIAIDPVNISNNEAECNSCICADDRAFYRSEYRECMYSLFQAMIAGIAGKDILRNRFCATVLEVFPNENGVGGHAVTLIACNEANGVSTGAVIYYVIDDQSKISTIDVYYIDHNQRIHHFSIRDIDEKTVINLNAILCAFCTVEKDVNRVTRYQLNFGKRFENCNGSQRLMEKYNVHDNLNENRGFGMSGGNYQSGGSGAFLEDPIGYLDNSIGYLADRVGGMRNLIIIASVIACVIVIVIVVVVVVVKKKKPEGGNEPTNNESSSNQSNSMEGGTISGNAPLTPSPTPLEGTPASVPTDSIPPAEEAATPATDTPAEEAAPADGATPPVPADGATPPELTKERVIQVIQMLKEKNPQFSSCWDGMIKEFNEKGIPSNNGKWQSVADDGTVTAILKDGKTITENLMIFCDRPAPTPQEDVAARFEDEAAAQKYAQFNDCLARLPMNAVVTADGSVVIRTANGSTGLGTIEEKCAAIAAADAEAAAGGDKGELAPVIDKASPPDVPTQDVVTPEGFVYRYAVL